MQTGAAAGVGVSENVRRRRGSDGAGELNGMQVEVGEAQGAQANEARGIGCLGRCWLNFPTERIVSGAVTVLGVLACLYHPPRPGSRCPFAWTVFLLTLIAGYFTARGHEEGVAPVVYDGSIGGGSDSDEE